MVWGFGRVSGAIPELKGVQVHGLLHNHRAESPAFLRVPVLCLAFPPK